MYYHLSKYYEEVRKKFLIADDHMKVVKNARRKLQQITKRSVVVEIIGWGITYGFVGKYDELGEVLSDDKIREQAEEKELKTRRYYYVKIRYSE
jgi:hypothetical protein